MPPLLSLPLLTAEWRALVAVQLAIGWHACDRRAGWSYLSREECCSSRERCSGLALISFLVHWSLSETRPHRLHRR
jgi:hypothetical protein